MTQTMTLDAALDFADDAFMAGNIAAPVSSFASPAEVEQALSRWNVKVEG